MEEKTYVSIDDLDVKAIVGAKDIDADISKDLPLRKWLYSWLLDPNIEGNYQKFFDKWISILIVPKSYGRTCTVTMQANRVRVN
jgi:hypothetical protein